MGGVNVILGQPEGEEGITKRTISGGGEEGVSCGG